MTPRDREAFDYWQSQQGLATERRLRDLTDAVDDLTTFAQSREGARMIRQNLPSLVSDLRKIHDLVIEFKPMETIA